MRARLLLLALASLFSGASSTCAAGKRQAEPAAPTVAHAAPALRNDSRFAPSFATLKFDPAGPDHVDSAALGDTVQCTGCHADVAAQFEGSAHRGSSFTNRFYAASVALTRKERGNKASRWCGGCHDPSLLFDGATASTVSPALDRDDVSAHPRAGDGIGCLLCHSIASGSRTGGGGYALAVRTFREPDIHDAKQVAEHKASMRSPVLAAPETCGSCHKVALDEAVNGRRWYRGQNDFDAWEQGPYALGGGKTASEIYAPDVEPARCVDCHMKEETAGLGDLAAHRPAGAGSDAKARVVRGHRFLAANTALPAFAGDRDTIARQAEFLRAAVRVELAAVRRASAPTMPADPTTSVPDDEERISLDVVVENTRVGHRFPTGTADANEVWLALEVRDGKGGLVVQSGEVAPNEALDSEVHRFGVLQLDATGKPALLRDAHRFAAIGWDTTIAPRDAKVIRYALALPKGTARPVTVTSRVLYRKFSPAYLKVACETDAASGPKPSACPTLPIIELDRDVVTLGAPRAKPLELPLWKRRDAYAKGLLDALQEDVGDAEPILAELLSLAPDRAHGFIDLARLRIRQGRTDDALQALDQAGKLDPSTPVVPLLRGVAKYEVYKLGDAVDPLTLAVARAPTSLKGHELLAEALELRGEDRSALDVVARGLAIDPESAQLRHLEALAFDRLGQVDDAEHARDGYLRYRRDDLTPALRGKCKSQVAGCARESVPLHVHWLVAAIGTSLK